MAATTGQLSDKQGASTAHGPANTPLDLLTPPPAPAIWLDPRPSATPSQRAAQVAGSL